MRTRKIPRSARRLRAYTEFESYLVDFAQGRYPFLWIVGRPGLAKTESLRAALRGRRTFYQKGGQLTPLQFYIACHSHRGEPIVLDDAEHLLENKVGAKLISALGDTTPAKLMTYGTTSRRMLGDVPDRYYTTSPLCIIANKTTQHEDIQSRAIVLDFDPTNLEIHQAVARWFWDQKIHNWFGEHLQRLQKIDTRWYLAAALDKAAGRDWRKILLGSYSVNRAAILVQDLEIDPAYPTRENKALRFEELLGNVPGASRATYFRLRGRLHEEGCLTPAIVPPIPLQRTRPPGMPSLLELNAMAAGSPDQPEEEPQVLDVPVRAEFAQPIQGHTPPQAAPPLDDSLPWESPEGQNEEDEM